MTVAPPISAGTAQSTGADSTQERRYRLLHRLVLVLGFFVYLPALRARYCFDDYFHASMVHGTYPSPRSPFNLYDFVGDSDRTAFFSRGAPFPWWSDPNLKLRFLRPLSSALIWGERRVIGDEPLLLHLISFGWWVAAVLGARAIFRHVLSPRAALISTAIFALAPCHSLPLAWLANREALLSLTFGLYGIGAALRFRDHGRSSQGLVATLFFSLSALSGEYFFGLGGYVLMLAITSRGASWSGRRLLGLGFFAAPSAVYLVTRSRLGYGSAGSGSYIDPLGKPLSFLIEAPRRLGPLLANGWLSLDGDTITQFSSRWWLVPLGVAGLLVIRSFRLALRDLDTRSRAGALWLLGGSLLALFPVLAVSPSPRLLGASMLGLSATVATLLEKAWFGQREQERYDQLGGLVALALGFLHLVHGPMTSWLLARRLEMSSSTFEAAAKDFAVRLAATKSSEVVVMRGGGGSLMLPFALDDTFAPPQRWHMLAQTDHVLALRRGPRTLDLIAPESLFPTGPGDLFRQETTPIAKGDSFTLGSMQVTVLEMGAHGPRIARFEMERDLDTYIWVAEERGAFREAQPPREGYGKPFDP